MLTLQKLKSTLANAFNKEVRAKIVASIKKAASSDKLFIAFTAVAGVACGALGVGVSMIMMPDQNDPKFVSGFLIAAGEGCVVAAMSAVAGGLAISQVSEMIGNRKTAVATAAPEQPKQP